MTAKRRRGGAGRIIGHVLGALLILLLLGFCVYLLYDRSEMTPSIEASDPVPAAATPEAAPTPEPTPTPLTLHLIVGGEEEDFLIPAGEALEQPEGKALPGQRFFAWLDESGAPVTDWPLFPEEDLTLEALCRPALGGEYHEAYLPPDEEGLLRPGEIMTRADAALMLYALLPEEAPDGQEDAGFADLSEDDACYAACSALRALGALEGETFEAEDTLTKGALLSMLRPFFPESSQDCVFSDLTEEDETRDAFCLAAERGWIDYKPGMEAVPQEALSRLQAAQLMNRVLGRRADPSVLDGDLPVIPDLPEDEEEALAMLEAAVPHAAEQTEEAERWSGMKLPWLPIPGFTTGDTEVDAWLKKIIDDKVDESKPQRDQLLALYIYVRDTFRYRKGEIYEEAAPGILLAETRKMMEEEGGNCYTHSALYCQLLRARGLEAKVCCGTIGNDASPHAWVEAEIDGSTYVFDPEMEKTNFRFHHPYYDFFMRTPYDVKGWDYQLDFDLT